MKPRVAITLNYKTAEPNDEIIVLDSRYIDYLLQGDAVPVPIIPSMDTNVIDSLLDTVSGLLLTGGLDLNPSLWGENPHPQTVSLHPRRHDSEFFLYRQARRRRMPIMGICLGIQVINVAQGGALHQHIPDIEKKILHRAEHGKAVHTICPVPGTKLFEWLEGQNVVVNSYHHQGINRLGQNLLAAAYAEPQLVEAVEDPDYPFLLGVQWHPERDPHDPCNEIIMNEFVNACRLYTFNGTK